MGYLSHTKTALIQAHELKVHKYAVYKNCINPLITIGM